MATWNEIKNRRGYFSIDLAKLHKNAELVQHIMASVIVLECSLNTSKIRLEYRAVSPLFNDIGSRGIVPYYQFSVDETNSLQITRISK